MATELVGAVWATAGSILAAGATAGATYWFTKKRERDADLRREKLDHYKALVLSLSGIIANEGTPDGQRAFAQACNNLLLFAPQAVIRAMKDFQMEARSSNTDRSKERHDLLLSKLMLEIRNDLGVHPKDDPGDFSVWLWASGVASEEESSRA